MTQIAELMSDAETVAVEYGGVTFHVEKLDPKDPPVDILEALEDDKPVAACRAILGDEQWKEFKKHKPRASDLNMLISKALGTDVGKSDTSSD